MSTSSTKVKTTLSSKVKSINEVFLTRKQMIVLEPQNNAINTNSKQYVATVLKNIEYLGFTFSKTIIEILQTYSTAHLNEFYLNVVPILKKMVGAHVKHKPMYPNFPAQVMEMHECELYINAIFHYLGFGLPSYEKEERLPLFENTKLKVIELGSLLDVMKMFSNLISSKTSISESDKEDVEWYITTNISMLADILPASIPSKENMSFIIGVLANNNIPITELSQYFKTATDVLRLAVSMSEGDVSLATNTKFKRFTRKERKELLTLLESVNSPVEDMNRYRGQWVRLGERLHPGEYKDRFPNVWKSFLEIRSDKTIETFNSKIEKSILTKDIKSSLHLLSKRPGEFARRLDKLLREASGPLQKLDVLGSFEDVASNVSTPVLLQVLTHFKYRTASKEKRVFFPKGNIAKLQSVDNLLPYIDYDSCQRVVLICTNALIKQYSNLPPLGKTYLDNNLMGYLVPFSQRSASKALKTIVRGSRIPLGEGNFVRMFTWWKNIGLKEGDYCNSGRVDIDLSSVLYDKNWYSQTCSYYSLKGSSFVHSGDITDAPYGASEFIDIDIEKALSEDVRYVLMSIKSFTGQKFSDIPECFAGFMMREDQISGEIYEPKTVQNKFDITSEGKSAVTLIIDLVKREMIWADMLITERKRYANNVRNNEDQLMLMTKALVELKKTDLYTLFDLHIKARGGELVETKEEAKTVFSVEDGITPFDIETIMGEYL